MSQESVGTSQPTRGHDIRMRIQRMRKSSRNSMFGVAEILAVTGSLVILIAVFFSYVYFLLPARSHLQARQLERSRLQKQLRSSDDLVRQGQTTQSTVDQIAESLADFEDNRLPNRSKGRMGLYDELNQLIQKNGLRNTSGPTYVALESVDAKRTAPEVKSASAKWQSVYPGIGVSLTVEGSYLNLRRFIRSLEASKQFIIVNAIELERATESNTAESASGGASGSLVSLRMDLATYFQRANGLPDSVTQ